MKTEKIEKLKELAKQIMAVNPECLISGSLALVMQGIKIRREPQDLDIYLPYGEKFTKIEGMYSVPKNGEYPPENWNRESYVLAKIQIDVFTPDDSDEKGLNAGGWFGDIGTVRPSDIIKFKFDHALGEHWTKHKHATDIIYMMAANV